MLRADRGLLTLGRWADLTAAGVSLAAAENRRMSAPAPLDVYRQVQAFLIKGEYGRLAEVADMDGYTDATSA